MKLPHLLMCCTLDPFETSLTLLAATSNINETQTKLHSPFGRGLHAQLMVRDGEGELGRPLVDTLQPLPDASHCLFYPLGGVDGLGAESPSSWCVLSGVVNSFKTSLMFSFFD